MVDKKTDEKEIKVIAIPLPPPPPGSNTPDCPECGTEMVRINNNWKCPNCGCVI